MYGYFSEERKGAEMVTGNLKGRKRKNRKQESRVAKQKRGEGTQGPVT